MNDYKQMRSTISTVGWALLVYMLIMNGVVMIVLFCDGFMQMARLILSGNADSAEAMEQFTQSLMENGWGYLLTIAIGYLILRFWKGNHFCNHVIWKRGKPMEAGSFFMLLCLMLSSQVIFQIIANTMEYILNLFDMSVMSSIESASANVSTLSMLLYMALGAPIAEELLFRGLVLRTLEPYGKRSAIIMSAFLFGMFHGNVVQIPFAMCVGLVLGYVAVEYSIGWAMLLHMVNNLVLGDSLVRLTSLLPQIWEDVIFSVILIGALIASVVILILRRRDVADYRQGHPMVKGIVKAFFTAPGILAFLIFILINVALTLLMTL